MFNIENLIVRLSQVNWLDFGRSAFSLLSCATVMFAFYIFYFDRGVFAFVSAFAYINFVFFTSILLTVSFGSARLFLFFFEHYLLPLVGSIVLLVMSVVAIFFAKLSARIPVRVINKLGLYFLQLGDSAREKLEQVRKFSMNPIAPFILGALIFLFVYLEGAVLKGVMALLAILVIGYLVFSLNLAYGAPNSPVSPEIKEESDKTIVSILRATAEDLLSAQRQLTDGIARSILLQQKLTDIYPVLFNQENARTFFLKFWGLIFLVASAALGYFRGEVVESSSLYTVALLQPNTEVGSRLLDVSVFLTANSVILVKDINSGDVLALPYDAIETLTSKGSGSSVFFSFSSGSM